MSSKPPRRRGARHLRKPSLRGFIIKVSIITGLFCAAVCGALFALSAANTRPAPVALAPIHWGASSTEAPDDSTQSAPLPEATFDQSSPDSYTRPAEPVSVSLRPSTLSVPSVGLNAPIVPTGEENGSMILPVSSKVAEFAGASALSATEGSTVIAGHVNFADGSWGAMGSLHEINKGAPVYATDSSGKLHKYKVTKMEVLSKQALPTEIFRTEGARQLVIVTCGGDVEMVNGKPAYTHNVVVTAEPVV